MKDVVDAWHPYQSGFQEQDAPFLTWWHIGPLSEPIPHTFSREQFLQLANCAVGALKRLEVNRGARVVHGFGGNHYLDLVFRLAACKVGAVPVTVNWEADTQERIAFKITHTDAVLLLHDASFAQKNLTAIEKSLPQLACLNVEDWVENKDAPHPAQEALTDLDEKIIIFTSGTTGLPKGVSHDYRSYRANAETFDAFFQRQQHDGLTCVVTSALHHANATAISDWCMRTAGAVLHLISRYSTRYWEILHTIATSTPHLLVAPVVSRHFDFLASLHAQNKLPVTLGKLQESLEKVTFLIGSAPVGPTTVKRIGTYTKRLPVVRFGSSETCLQVMGIPPQLPQESRLLAFRRGWAKENRTGYYIGRPHPEHTEVRVVAAIDKTHPDFMKEVPEGVPGYLVTRGANVMTSYVKDEAETRSVMAEDWYLGLQDIGFYLCNEGDGERDFYWMSRESTLLIKGGANYAYDQINSELQSFLQDHLKVEAGYLDVAVVGLKLDSEHEDTCCATVNLQEEDTAQVRKKVEGLLLGDEAKSLTKGARPDRVRFGTIPRNFKGAVVVAELRKAFEPQ